MNLTRLFFFIFLALSIVACDNEPNPVDLNGNWKTKNAFVDGLGTSALGTITFSDQTENTMNVWYVVEGDTITKNGVFTYTASNEALQIDLNGTKLNWRRADNRAEEQEFQFDEMINQKEYNIILEFVPE